MIRTAAIVASRVLACAAQAMPLGQVHQPDDMITQARMGCGAGKGNGQRCLPVQSRHAPGAPSQPQVCPIFWRRLRSLAVIECFSKADRECQTCAG